MLLGFVKRCSVRCCKRVKFSIALQRPRTVCSVVFVQQAKNEQCDPLLADAWPLVNTTMPCPHLLAAPAQCDASKAENAREHDMGRMRSIATRGPSVPICKALATSKTVELTRNNYGG